MQRNRQMGWEKSKMYPGKRCPDAKNIKNGDFDHVEGNRVGNKVYYTCFPGYKIPGPNYIQCGQNAQWNRDPPKCKVITCEKPQPPRYASIVKKRGNPKRYIYGKRIQFRCNNGAASFGLPIWVCGIEGSWLINNFRCLPKSCGDPRTPANGRRQGRLFTLGKKVQYFCNYGYDLRGSRYRICHANQRWSGRLPSCVPKDCGSLPAPANGRKVFEEKTTFGGTVRFQCSKHLGYELKGSQRRTCQGNGQWSGAQTTCQLISCGDPGVVRYGSQRASNGNFYGSSVRFDCNPGYTLVGDSSILCQKDKSWSGVPPKCYAPCPSPPRANGRTVLGNDFSHGKSISFSCHRDFIVHGRRRIRCSNGRWSDNFPVCKDCKLALGMENSTIPDDNINASNYIKTSYPHLARLHGKKAWCTKKFVNAYLQINLGTLHRITAIAAQGSKYDWIDLTTCSVRYKSGNRFVPYREGQKAEVIPGGDKTTVNKYEFKKEFETTTVRIYPKNAKGTKVACLRVELYGCKLTQG